VRASKRASLLDAARRGDGKALVSALVAESSPRPLLRNDLGARLSLSAEAIARAAEALVASGELVPVGVVGWIGKSVLAELGARAHSLVADHHRAAPLEPGLPLQTLREQISALAGPEVTAELLTRIAAASKLVTEGDVVRLASFGGVAADAAASRAFETASTLLRQAALAGVTENALAQAASKGDVKQARALLGLLVRKGAAVHAADLWFDAGAVQQLRERVADHFGHHGKLTIADFKAMTGLGRRQTIPLLEHLDREGVTRRQGDDRVPGR
jgi:selenocysteine-specific elongation factor